MRKQLLALFILSILINITSVNAELDYYDYASFKIKKLSNENENASITTQNSTQEQDVTTNSNDIYTNTKPTTIQGSVVSTQTVHYGKNITDEEGNFVVNKIGRKLMQASNIDKNVYFVYSTDKIVNAQTEFNGTITIFKGIVNCCENEDELAFVIGHEIGHADGYHIVKANVVNSGLDIGVRHISSILNNNISNRINGFGLGGKNTWSNILVDKTQKLSEATYSKAHEKDADIKAVDYMVKSGYNPLAGISILSKTAITYPDLFTDHPSTDKRCRTVYNYIKQKYPQYISKDYDTQAYRNAYETYIKQ